MIDARIVLLVFCIYMGFLFLLARWAERSSTGGRSRTNNPLVYSLSLAVYCTAWTYYGSVGKAASSGMLFLPIYLGPTASIFLWWIILRKLVRLKGSHRITSIADFISARYDKSQFVAALVTVMAIVGIMPYIALQLKAITSTFLIITGPYSGDLLANTAPDSWIRSHVGPLVTCLMIAFTLVFGVRRLDPTERHEGMVMALAVECVVKLAAFLVVGIFVSYFLYDGVGDIFSRLAASPFRDLGSLQGKDTSYYFTWCNYLILSMSAILLLPRQFHVAVVENHDETHILTAMWLFPLYMLLINIFVFPIAAAGLLSGYPVSEADTFVLRLPLLHGGPWLPLLVFIGGFSATAGMVMISSVTISTMVTNHLLLPLIEEIDCLGFLRRHLLKCRWGVVMAFISLGYWSAEKIFETEMLVNIGLISFAAVLQFAPAILGGLFWRKGSKAGAIMGMSAGFAVWCYTQMVPSFVRKGWLSLSLLREGPWGLGFLSPDGLLGMSALDPLSQTVLWSMMFNVTFYILGSLFFGVSAREQSIAEEFAGILDRPGPISRSRHGEAYIDLAAKREEIETLLSRYYSEGEAAVIVARCIEEVGINDASLISITHLIELHDAVEKYLAGAIGTAAAYRALRQGLVLAPREEEDLSKVYTQILADFRLTPAELQSKIDYHQEKECLLMEQARELEEKVEALKAEILERRRVQEALRESEERFRGLVENMNEGLEIEDERGMITYVNKTLCNMLGCGRDTLIGKPAAHFLGAAQWNRLKEQMANRKGSDVESYEVSWVSNEGHTVWAIMSPVPILGIAGNYRGRFAVFIDISNLKGLEREKANMISMFAHDMKSSLAGIHGLALRLLSKAATMEEGKKTEHLRIINKEASKLESLVDDFLEFSRLETGRLKLNFGSVSLDKELLEVFEAYQIRAAQKDLKLELSIGEALPIIQADVNRLRRVFTNLLDNSLKFSGERGTITIAAEESGPEVIVRIMDDGIGIAPEEVPYIFDLFHRGRDSEKREGYGIGLATVKAIVEGHGGRVHVSSRLGMGTTFTISLPKQQKTRGD